MKLKETSGTKMGGEIGMKGMWVYFIKKYYLHMEFINKMNCVFIQTAIWLKLRTISLIKKNNKNNNNKKN